MNYISKCRLWLEAVEGVEAYINRRIAALAENENLGKEEKEELMDCYNDIILTLEAVLKKDIE